MSSWTKQKRAEKEAKRLPSRYVPPVKPKPRELLWLRYKKTGLKYEPYEMSDKEREAEDIAEQKELVDAGK